jgi:hypothetical protein
MVFTRNPPSVIVDVTEPPAPRIVDLTPSTAIPHLTPPGSPVAAPPHVASPAQKLYVATPCYGCMMSNTFLVGLMQLQAECVKRNIECFIDFVGQESLVQRARNILAARFLKSKATHLLFIDADIGFNPEAVFRLLDADKDISSAIYAKKAFDWGAIATKVAEKSTEPIEMMGLDFNLNIAGPTAHINEGFVKVLDSATGFMCIARRVLEKMAIHFAPSLSCVNDLPGDRADPGYVAEYVAVFDCLIDKDTRRYLSEDYSFVRRAQELGFEVYADVASPLVHVGNYHFNADLRKMYTMVYSG